MDQLLLASSLLLWELVLVIGAEMEESKAFAEEFKLDQPIMVAHPGSNKWMKDYKALMTPSYCLIDEQGKVKSTGYPNSGFGEWKNFIMGWEAHVPTLI